MGKCKRKNDLEKDVAQIYWLILNLGRTQKKGKAPEKVKAVRCHESVRMFYNVLKNHGYRVEIVNGGYSLTDENMMQHSWVEYLVDDYGTSLIIETTPHLFFQDLSSEERVDKMVILPDDERRQKYHPLQDDLFFEVLKRRRVKKINEQLVKDYTSLITRLINRKKS